MRWNWNVLKRKKGILTALVFLLCFALFFNIASAMAGQRREVSGRILTWVDFKVTAQAMEDALAYDMASHDTEQPIHWIDLLALLGAKYGGEFKNRYRKADMDAFAARLQKGETAEDIVADNTYLKYFDYYSVAYESVLGGLVGEYSLQTEESAGGSPVFAPKYGLKAYSPIAEGWAYSHNADFGSAREFGFKRSHLGHDMFGSVGTPMSVATKRDEATSEKRYPTVSAASCGMEKAETETSPIANGSPVSKMRQPSSTPVSVAMASAVLPFA